MQSSGLLEFGVRQKLPQGAHRLALGRVNRQIQRLEAIGDTLLRYGNDQRFAGFGCKARRIACECLDVVAGPSDRDADQKGISRRVARDRRQDGTEQAAIADPWRSAPDHCDF